MSGSRLGALLAVLLLLLGAGSALAEGTTSSLTLTGTAVVIRGNPPHLLLNANAADGSGWRLDLTLTPTQPKLASDGQTVLGLAGTYQLSSPKVPVVSGAAVGTLGQNGSGQLQLTLPTDAVAPPTSPLAATFTLSPQGTIRVTLTGMLPAPPPPPVVGPVNHTFWYLSRASGFLAYALLTLTVCLGLLVQTKLMDWLVARWQTFDLHQFTALLALGVVGFHILSLLGDQYAGFSLAQLFVPFLSTYRPVEVALGIVGFYLFVMVVGSFYARREIGYASWRAIHYLTFGVFLLALGHGILAGTDSSTPWATLIYLGSGLLVLALTYGRIQRSATPRRHGPVPVEIDAPRP